MNDPSTNGHAGYWDEVRRIWDIAQVTPGLPIPQISATRAVFDYRRITHARDAAESVARAETILSYELSLTFERADAMAGDDTMRYILRAFLPSGLAVDIVAKSAHMAASRPQLASAA